MINLEQKYLEMLQNILQKNIPDKTVWLFGSRTTEKIKRYSDIDLVIISENRIPWDIIFHLKEDLDESDLPYKVDILDWSTLDNDFKKIIQGRYEIIQ